MKSNRRTRAPKPEPQRQSKCNPEWSHPGSTRGQELQVMLLVAKCREAPGPGGDKPLQHGRVSSSKTAKSHFLWTDCTRLFLHFSERASFTPLCSPSTHPPWQHIPLSSPPSATWTTTTCVHAGRDSLVSDVAQTGASRVEVPATQRRKKETRSGAQRGPRGLESWAWSLH